MIHQYKSNGYNIVIDVNSGSIHVVDDIVYDMIPLVEPLVNEGIKDADTIRAAVLNIANLPCPEEEIAEAVDELLLLESMGQLFAPDIYENYVFDFKKRETVVKALCLHIAHDCNLACQYCFAEEGEYHGRRALMSFDVGRKALDFLVANSGSRVNLEVDFFGGEHRRSEFHYLIIGDAVDVERVLRDNGVDRLAVGGFYHYHTTDARILRSRCDEIPGGIVLSKIIAVSLKIFVNLAQRLLVCKNHYKHTLFSFDGLTFTFCHFVSISLLPVLFYKTDTCRTV